MTIHRTVRRLAYCAALAAGLGLGTAAPAADQADEYPPLPRLSANYEVGERTQNEDAVKMPVSINGAVEVEGRVIRIAYAYQDDQVNASPLQFRRHFAALAGRLGGEVVYQGNTEEFALASTIRFPQGGRTVWALATSGDAEDIYHYQLVVVETATPWTQRGAATSPR